MIGSRSRRRGAARRARVVAGTALVIALTTGAAAPANAREASAAQVAALARQASTSPAALARLRAVDSVDGRPLRVADALAGATGAELRARLAVLVTPATGHPGPTAAGARSRAASIVAEQRFHGSSTPRPLHGVLTAIGKAVKVVLDPIGRLIDRLGGHVPGGAPAVWLLLAALVLAAAALFTSRAVRRRGAEVERLRGMGVGAPGGLDPAALERAADEAERAGDLEHAVRLRFQAGLLRLDGVRAIEFRDSMTTTEVSHALDSPAFDELALTFEEVAYGGRDALPPDVDAARRGWPALLAEFGSR